MHRVVQATSEQILHAAGRINAGELVAFATETVYGLGADALNAVAVAAIFQAKERPLYDPLIVHVADVAQARQLCTRWPATAALLAEAFWPGPLTLVLPRASHVPDLVTAGLHHVALRCPDHPVAQALLQASRTPIAAPSANRFGGISPTSAGDVARELDTQDLLILDGGPCRHGLESTVVSLATDTPTVLRLGSLTVEQLEQVTGRVSVQMDRADAASIGKGLASPGNLARHYAPRTAMALLGQEATSTHHRHEGLLTFGPATGIESHFAQVENLSPEGNLVEAAASLYATLRRLDDAGLQCIRAQLLPETGLGRAINDRLRRACHG